MTKETRSYGTWPSPISAEMVAKGAKRFSQVQIHGGTIYWVETRPDEGGRSVLTKALPGGNVEDVIPSGYNVRSRVHEYGGLAYAIYQDHVYFSNANDGCVYGIVGDQEPMAITPQNGNRYADFDVSKNGREIFCVREQHTDGEPVNDVVCLTDGNVMDVASGHDFFAYPRISPNGKQLAWISWDHPNMPWDGTQLWVGDWVGSCVENVTCIAGGRDQSISQPTWGSDGKLHFVSDEMGWWNPYVWDGTEKRCILRKNSEFGLPLWSLGVTTFAELEAGAWVYAFYQDGFGHLGLKLGENEDLATLDLPFTDFTSVGAEGHEVAFVGGAWDQAAAVVVWNCQTGIHRIVRENEIDIAPTHFSQPKAISYGVDSGEKVHAFYYPPQNPDFAGGETERPPLIVKSHGGPTGSSSGTLDLGIQFWTSRGFAVLDVNYRGSTGFGRDYRCALYGEWGVMDVVDCVAGAEFLVKKGKVDADRLLIRGGSAGGLTTLCALAFHDVFCGGASYYGVSDLASLAEITHKFESRYLDNLLGTGDITETMKSRSPLFAADHIGVPVIFFQGSDDPVVPPQQTDTMVQALKDNGIPVCSVQFEGEMHGFRKAENIIRSLKDEYTFYVHILDLKGAQDLTDISIER